MDNNILSFLGLMHKAGSLALGGENAYDAARTHRARLLVLAEDCGPNTAAQIRSAARQAEAPIARLPCTKAALGGALGQRECAALAVTDTGFALSLCRKCGWPAQAEQLEARLAREKKRKQKKIDRTAAKRAGTDTRKGGNNL